jgi:Na+/proline symporter
MNALTGMDIYLAGFLMPWGVMIYTVAGGLKATFMSSYIHTAVIFLILVVFVYTIYLKVYSSDIIYDMLQTTVPFTSPRFIVY